MKGYTDEFPLLPAHGLYAAEILGDGKTTFISCFIREITRNPTPQATASSTLSPTSFTALRTNTT